MQVYFEVVREAGPPHMRTFLTKCIVGDFLTEGEGNGKKVGDIIKTHDMMTPCHDNIIKP